MVILNRKRISLMLLVVIIGIFTFEYQLAKTERETMKVTASPISSKTVVIDAGHGTPDEGAKSKEGTTEAQINLKIALKVQNLLEQSGCTVILTRSDDNGIYDLDKNTLREKKVSDIKNRVKIGNESSADIFVSIHLNKIPESQYYGWQCFYKYNDDKSKELANNLQNSLNESIDKINDRVPLPIKKIYIVEHVEIPISIVECGFLSNPEEEQQLQTEKYQEEIAWGIYNGIISYFA